MTAMTTDQNRSPEALRAEMVDRIITYRRSIPGLHPLSDRVLEVMRAVPRHAFVPDATVEQAYANEAVITKRANDGAALSCASVPTVVGMMLHHLDVQPGHRVLEIGAGTGYNAALLAELAGPTGQVTTVDIDPDVTTGARRALDAAGYPQVRVVTGDGQAGDPDYSPPAPYDRLIVTVGPWDLPPAWWQQLSAGGRMVVPLRWRGQARTIAFIHHHDQHGDRLVSDAEELCGFVPMLGQDGERSAPLAGGLLTLTWDIDQPIDPNRLHNIFDQPGQPAWSGEWIGPVESLDGITLRLAATEPGACRLVAEPAAIQAGLQHEVMPPRYPAVVETDSLAYLTLRRASSGERRWELGAIGHGPHGTQLAERICHQIRTWSHHRTTQPAITAYPASTPVHIDGHIVDKPHTRLLVTF